LEDRVAEINPFEIIAECIENCKRTTDRDQIAHYIAEALGFLQIEDSEEDAFSMLGNAIVEAGNADQEHCSVLLDVWNGLEQERRSP
jgi:hypothetical protein